VKLREMALADDGRGGPSRRRFHAENRLAVSGRASRNGRRRKPLTRAKGTEEAAWVAN